MCLKKKQSKYRALDICLYFQPIANVFNRFPKQQITFPVFPVASFNLFSSSPVSVRICFLGVMWLVVEYVTARPAVVYDMIMEQGAPYEHPCLMAPMIGLYRMLVASCFLAASHLCGAELTARCVLRQPSLQQCCAVVCFSGR